MIVSSITAGSHSGHTRITRLSQGTLAQVGRAVSQTACRRFESCRGYHTIRFITFPRAIPRLWGAMFSPKSSLPTFLIVSTDCLARAGVSSCPFTRLWWAFRGCLTLQGEHRFPRRRAPIIPAGALAITGHRRRLGAVLRTRAAHCNEGRPHRSLDLETPTGPPARAGPAKAGRIVARPILGGLHHECEWVAA